MIVLNQAKQYLQFSNSDYDTLLTQIIEYSIGYIENYVGGSLATATETKSYQGTGRQYLPLLSNNVTTVSEVKIDGVTLSNTLYSIKNKMLFKKDLWEKTYINEYVVDYNIDVTLTSGYTYPTINNAINNGTVPKELQYVCLELVKKIFITSGTEQQTSSERGTQKNASFGVSYFEINFTDNLPKDLVRILDKYKR